MTQKTDYTKILDNIGCQYGDVAIIGGKEWGCRGTPATQKGRYFFTTGTGNLYSNDEAFKPTAIWRRKFPDTLATNICDSKELLTQWQCIWHESEPLKPKRKITIEVDEGAEVLVNGKKIEV